jgi:hypothetical protein
MPSTLVPYCTHVGQQIWKARTETRAPLLGFHYTDFHETHYHSLTFCGLFRVEIVQIGRKISKICNEVRARYQTHSVPVAFRMRRTSRHSWAVCAEAAASRRLSWYSWHCCEMFSCEVSCCEVSCCEVSCCEVSCCEVSCCQFNQCAVIKCKKICNCIVLGQLQLVKSLHTGVQGVVGVLDGTSVCMLSYVDLEIEL